MMFLKRFFPSREESGIAEEKMEEYRMLSGFKANEIIRIHRIFQDLNEDQGFITKSDFLSLPGIENNPLKERICFCFGFSEDCTSLDFQQFLVGLAMFNSPGQREQKLKTAFKMQDFDNDGVINHSDLVNYLNLITSNSLTTEEIDVIASQILSESSSDLNQESLSFADFQKVIAPLDFQAKLLLPI
jgi:Ca2+-binding EF-hand superfamily protein|mmetsp:Transcript_7984/g.8750  ORF Transcript_7984/g.8750 Transcript_7984/m.8750 type:complete len:187 (-) Transcript_7984:830-1390(-)